MTKARVSCCLGSLISHSIQDVLSECDLSALNQNCMPGELFVRKRPESMFCISKAPGNTGKNSVVPKYLQLRQAKSGLFC